VDAKKCNLCGDCEGVCPVTIPAGGEGGNGIEHKAIWHKENGFPKQYAIDFKNCTKCGECVKVCKTSAIDLDDSDPEQMELDVGTITLAIGSKLYEPEEGEYGFRQHPNIITNEEMEQLLHHRTEDKLVLNGKELEKVAIIHCVGSREPEKGFGGCSRYCCQVALKQANELRDIGVEVVDYYRDIRAFSKGAEKLYLDTRLKGVLYFRFTLETRPEVIIDGDELKMRVMDTLYGQTVELSFDAIVLACGMRAFEQDTKHLKEMTKIPIGGDGFFLERHPKLAPIETNTDGIYICGCAQYPKDVTDSIAQGAGAAAKSAIPLANGKVTSESIPSVVEKDMCTGCGTCEIVCPYGAIRFDEEGKAEVINVLCKGCGTCRAACPELAIKAPHFTMEEILAQINAIVGGVK
jgi:heterodisulfide reductase subunit A